MRRCTPGGGVDLATPQIEVDLRIMIFGFEKARAIPDATPAPATTLFNSPISLAARAGC